MKEGRKEIMTPPKGPNMSPEIDPNLKEIYDISEKRMQNNDPKETLQDSREYRKTA